jgi:transposase InsO family protein
MAYSTNPNLPRARAIALRLLIEQDLPASVVANKCGVNRSTIYRWKKRWNKLNENVQLTNDNRPTRAAGNKFRFAALTWNVPTLSSRPKTSPKAIPGKIVELVVALRRMLKRCAEVVWFHLVNDNGVQISLSSVRRILKRHHCFDGARKKRIRPDNPRRPHVTRPGELVETDTIHYVRMGTTRRVYVYTVIDVFSRMAYAEVHPKILPGIAAQVVMHARNEFGYDFHMVQADNGPEFSRYFEQVLARDNMPVRHTRLGRPNDNSHIERFNKTVQVECLGSTITRSTPITHMQGKLDNYLHYYNFKRVHLSLQFKTPAGYAFDMLRRS